VDTLPVDRAGDPDAAAEASPEIPADTAGPEATPDGTGGDVTPPCVSASCDDSDPCTKDYCKNNACVNEPIPECCPGKTLMSMDFEAADTAEKLVVENLVPPYPDKPDAVPVVWNVTGHKAHSPSHALYFGRPDSLTYDNGHRVAASATLPPVDLPAGVPLHLAFWCYADVEEGEYSDDFAVFAVVDGQQLPLWRRTEATPLAAWAAVVVDITPLAGKSAAFRFLFDSRDEHENSGEGVLVDDVLVEKGCSPLPACQADAGCKTQLTCASGTCKDGACSYEFDSECCIIPNECEDWDGCTVDACSDHACVSQPDPDPQCCNANEECLDADPVCTTDICKNNGCVFVPSGAPGCCANDSDCDDSDSCTTDMCNDMACFHVNLCCAVDGDCDDGDDTCTADSCVDGKCAFVATQAEGCCVVNPVNEGFESGQAPGWTLDATEPSLMQCAVSSEAAHTGENSLACVSQLTSEVVEVSAALPVAKIPVGATLTFWLKTTMPFSGDCYYNSLQVLAGDAVLIEQCNSSTDWTKMSVNLAGVAGNDGPIAFHFYGETDSWEADEVVYSIHIDDVKLTQDCCSKDSDCSDGNPCTDDSCPGLNSNCVFSPITGCCLSSSECSDDDACTLDLCKDNSCQHIDACCETDSECNDGDDACTKDYCLSGACVFEPLPVAGCCSPQVAFEGFESGTLQGWDIACSHPGYCWHLTTVEASSGQASLYYGNPAGTDYGEDNEGSIISPPIELPAGSIFLSFKTYYATEEDFDTASVNVVAGDEDILVAEYSGATFEWVEQLLDISQFAGQQVRIRFSFSSDILFSDTGFFVDDLAVTRLCCDTDADCDDDNPCTTDSCPGPGSECFFAPVPGCCNLAADCGDADPCTSDACVDLQCVHTNLCCTEDADCDDGDPVCTKEVCVEGFCKVTPTGEPGCCTTPLFFDDFYTDKGWDLGPEWDVGPAKASSCSFLGYEDPAKDYSASDDNYIAGVNIGGCVDSWQHPMRYLTSPEIPVPAGTDSLFLDYWRWLNSDYAPFENNVVEVFDGTSWKLIWESGPDVAYSDSEWTYQSHDVSQYAGPGFRVRFGFEIADDWVFAESGWNLDDVRVTTKLSDVCCTSDLDCAGFGQSCVLGACE
jgi:hypothetical protein